MSFRLSTNLETNLLETRTPLFFHTNSAKVHHPFQTHGRVRNRILLQLSVQSIRQQHKYLNLSFPAAVSTDYYLMLYRSPFIDGQAIIAQAWFSTCTTDVTLSYPSPIIGQTVRKTVSQLSNHPNGTRQRIISHVSARHLSASSTKKSEVQQVWTKCSRWYLEFSVTLFTQRQVTVRTTTELSIPPVGITT